MTDAEKKQMDEIYKDVAGMDYYELLRSCQVYNCRIENLVFFMAKARGLNVVPQPVFDSQKHIPAKLVVSDKVVDALLKEIVGREIKVMIEKKKGENDG